MKYFRVYVKSIAGQVARTPVDRDGDAVCLADEEEFDEIILGYEVDEWDEDSQVITDSKYYDAYEKDTDKVLAEIEADHPAGEWQNDEW